MKKGLDKEYVIAAKKLRHICAYVSETNYSDAFCIKSRYRSVVEARQLFCFIFNKKYPRISLVDLGSLIYDNPDLSLDHATVIHSITTVNSLSSVDVIFRQKLTKAISMFETRLNGSNKKNMFIHHLTMLEKPKLRIKQRFLV